MNDPRYRWLSGVCFFMAIYFGTAFVRADDAVVKPNVLMICIDDLNDWVGFLEGHPQAITPNLDALANRGCVFSNAHCAVPVCSASRISVMSGVAATTHGSYELGPRYEQLPALKSIPTMQRYFRDNGYASVSGGKVLHHGFAGRLESDIDRSLGRNRGPVPKKPMNRPDHWSRAWDWGAFPEEDGQMPDFQLATQAAKFLRQDFDRPFFLSVGFFRPHVPLYVPSKWFQLYPREMLQLPVLPRSDLDDLPPNFLTINNYAAAPTHADVLKHDRQLGLTRAYLASISFVDHCVGVVMNALGESPNAENTIVVLWSDHGFHLGEKHHWAKRTLWEESTRVPLVFAGPGIGSGDVCVEPANLIDIYPTLAELCSLPNNPHLEGISLAEQLRDPSAGRAVPSITSSYFGNHSIRSRDWRLIVYDDGGEELYDHREDPNELRNLAGDPSFKATRDELIRWLPKNTAPEFKARSERRKAE
ncbi:MAG: sulfatase [Planctomycetota bacterium]